MITVVFYYNLHVYTNDYGIVLLQSTCIHQCLQYCFITIYMYTQMITVLFYYNLHVYTNDYGIVLLQSTCIHK